MSKIRIISIAGVMSGIAVVLAMLIHFPIIPAMTFLEYDPADVMIYLCTYLFGLPIGLAMTVVVSVIQGITVSSSSGIIGILSHILATGGFACSSYAVFCLIKKITKKNQNEGKKDTVAIIGGTLSGVLVMVIVCTLWNILVTPMHMGIDRDFLIKNYLPFIVLFNVFKGGLNGVISGVLYFPLGKAIKKITGGKRE